MNSPSAPHLAGHYVVNYKKEGDQHYALDLRTLQLCRCKEYPATTFLALAPLILSDIEGVHEVLGVTQLNGKFYVFSPRTFGDLHNFLKERRQLKEGLAANIFRQIGLLVRDAHRKNVVLRDLKLKNFVFEDQDKTRLRFHTLDDAHLHNGSDILIDRRGCPAYVCPEMLLPGSYSGQARDLWSLGVILYTLLVGHYPFFDTNPQMLFTKIRSGYYAVPESVSRLGRNVISSLLAHDPARRVTAEILLHHPWFEKARDEPLFPAPLTDQTVATAPLFPAPLADQTVATAPLFPAPLADQTVATAPLFPAPLADQTVATVLLFPAPLADQTVATVLLFPAPLTNHRQ